MSEVETRDAYHEVVVDLPNGKVMRGKPISYAHGMALIGLRQNFIETGAGGLLVQYLEKFHALTGTKPDAPELADLTPGEVLDATDRFFFWRRPVRTEVPAPPSPAANPT